MRSPIPSLDCLPRDSGTITKGARPERYFWPKPPGILSWTSLLGPNGGGAFALRGRDALRGYKDRLRRTGRGRASA